VLLLLRAKVAGERKLCVCDAAGNVVRLESKFGRNCRSVSSGRIEGGTPPQTPSLHNEVDQWEKEARGPPHTVVLIIERKRGHAS